MITVCAFQLHLVLDLLNFELAEQKISLLLKLLRLGV